MSNLRGHARTGRLSIGTKCHASGRWFTPMDAVTFLCFFCMVLATLWAPGTALAQGTPAVTPFIAGGHDDDNSVEANAIVRLVSNKLCTGTLITPMAVLTARHCLNGDDTNPPMTFPIQVQVGGDSNNFLKVYTSNNIIPSRAWATGPQTTGNPGNDIAVLFLDPPGNAIPGSMPGPVLELAQIGHPSLVSPCPTSGCGDDANGGTYDPQLGMVGWAPSDAPRFRQIAFDSEFHHFPGKPDDRGQYWQHVQGSIHDDPGDSGGPLFVRRPVPGRPGLFFRDVIGVLSDVRHKRLR